MVAQDPTSEKTYTRKIGRRKEATAQIRMASGQGTVTVNERTVETYFPYFEYQNMIQAPFVASGMQGKFDVSAKVKGGGLKGQAESIRLAIARALTAHDPEFRPALKKLGYLKRDARVKERKKYGKKKARRSPQWSKR